METPDGAAPGAGRPLYGERWDSINRRALLAGLGASVAALPGHAVARRHVDRLWWRGTAHVEVGGRSLDLTVETSLTVPLLQVRSTSFITSEGAATARTLILEPDGAWVERGGTRTPLPAQLGIHERQQYAIYGWLLLVQQAASARRQAQAARGRTLQLASPPWPDIAFDIGADGYPTAAALTVEAPELGKPAIAERVVFTGRIDDAEVRWPRRFAIAQDDRPYFTLSITEFRAG